VAGTYVSEVVNLLEVSQEMIEIDVHFAQVDYSKGKNIGSNIMKDLKITGDVAGGSGVPSTTSFGLALNALSKLNLLLTQGAGQIVSQPHLSTISGKTATFHSGGEIGYEVSGVGAANVQWKKYGLILNIQPVIESSGNIKTHIYIEVSSPVATGGTAEKAFTVFNTESDLVCKQGESVVISGLIQGIKNKFQEKTPILGSIPILDFFFKHKTADDVNKQLVVIVTPTVTTITKTQAPPLSKSYEDTLKKSEEDVDLEGRRKK
jgi:pilus assembly protein CpaC